MEVSKMQKSLFKDAKKGQLGNLTSNAIVMGVLIIVVAVMALVVSNVRDTQTANSLGYNVAQNGLTGFNNISGQFGLLGTIVIFSVVIGLVIAGFVVFARGR